jgi:hypothetical protein
MPSTSAILSVVDTYEVDAVTGRVKIRSGLVAEVLEKRQYAAEADGRILASFPAEREDEQYLVYFDSNSGALDWFDAGPSESDSETAHRLWQALQGRFAAVSDRRVASVPSPLAAETNQ